MPFKQLRTSPTEADREARIDAAVRAISWLPPDGLRHPVIAALYGDF